jgi:rhomboid protease GluP
LMAPSEEGDFPFAQRGPWGEPVPEPWEFLPTPRKPLGAFSRWPLPKYARMTLLLGLLICAASLLQWGAGLDLSASGKAVFANHEYWRLFTALIVHGDLAHLGSNMLPFLFFGWMLQSYFGFWVFPLLALAVGIASNAITVSLYPAQTHLLGASGMIYGMIALWLVLYLRFDEERAVPKRIARAIGFALLMLMPTTYDPAVSHLAHASGFMAGLTGGFIVMPFVVVRDPSKV